MSGVNKAILIGHLGRDPDVRHSGEKHQDNDLVIICSAPLASAFRSEFETIFAQGEAWK